MVWSVSYRQHSEPSTETDGPSITCCDSSVHSRTCSCLSHDRRERIRTPRAGTVEKLVEYLAPYRTDVDVSYRTCFLSTYRTFMTAGRLIELLKERYERQVYKRVLTKFFMNPLLTCIHGPVIPPIQYPHSILAPTFFGCSLWIQPSLALHIPTLEKSRISQLLLLFPVSLAWTQPWPTLLTLRADGIPQTPYPGS